MITENKLTVILIINLIELNKRIIKKYSTILKTQVNLDAILGLQFATVIDLNKGYYAMRIDECNQKLCTVVLPLG